MNATKKPAAPRKSRAKNASQSAAPAATAAATDNAQQATSVAVAVSASPIPEKALTSVTYTSMAKTKKGAYHSLVCSNMVGVASEAQKAARVPFKELGLLSAFAVDKRYAVKTGNRTYVVLEAKAPKACKAGKDMLVTPLDVEIATSGASDFEVAPPKPRQLEKIEKAAKRAAKKTEKKAAKALVKPNGAKPVLQPQATFHPHPPVGGAAQ